jgi:hypothetical protein
MPKARTEAQLVCERFKQQNIDYVRGVLASISECYPWLPTDKLLREFCSKRLENMVLTPFRELANFYTDAILAQVANRLGVPTEQARQLLGSSDMASQVLQEVQVPQIQGTISEITHQYVESILEDLASGYCLPLDALKARYVLPQQSRSAIAAQAESSPTPS